MMTPFQTIICSLFISISISAQTDSTAFVHANWKILKLKKGIVLKQYSFEGSIFKSSQTISILEIKTFRKRKFAFGFEQKSLKNTSDFGLEAKALAAINGTFFESKNGGSVDFLKVNNIIISQNQLPNNIRAFHQKAAIVIDKSAIDIKKWDGNEDWENKFPFSNVMVSGPLLIFEKKMQYLDTTAFNKNRHPRSLVAKTNRGRILLITIDGRNKNAQGMSLFEVQKMLQWLDIKSAINLDGGGSTTLYIKNQPHKGVVNFPCDNKIWDHEGERKVANVLMILQ